MNEIVDTYRTIAEPSKGIYKEKGSKFIAFAYPVSDESEIKKLLTELKKKYFDARHHCFAWRLGADGSARRAVDDGEPSGTGGRPILGQLLSNNLTNVVIFVVRYFGGIKLGASGLINAYRSAAADAVASAQITVKENRDVFTVRFDYVATNDVMKIVKDKNIEILNRSFDSVCRMKLSARKGITDSLKTGLLKIDSVSIED